MECSDGSYYTGITTDTQRRLLEHNFSFKSAKYTRSRRPVRLVYEEASQNRSTASKREYQMKKTDLVKVKEGHKSEGQLGVIVEVSKGLANVYWHSGKVYWIETKLLEVVNDETR